ncbi:hypothetical protein J8273_0125 [Carpediemonas membranifera]|uniref:Uncharacterized protein n=1 Tax=Carpediemonas membranifera TaxID=201153 RepID=A0A8J6BD12_9EUKA|nr:hypothetical protein J8273_0125 [Carpediemonas membranifera]|eukprot:KAG9394917.1 hypothetical protein J8273_0125 [Carpediemonas membranifera]
MSSESSSPIDARDALISAFRASFTVTASIAGDIPSLLRHAYSRHFGKIMPAERVSAEPVDDSFDDSTREELLALLNGIPTLKPKAQALLDRARSILTDGPPLSMNVELEDGQELPVALHTLLQGTLWAVMITAGANPDLEDRVLQKAEQEAPCMSHIHRMICDALTSEAKCLWFLCRKFFFSLNVAEKDGESYTYSFRDLLYHHCMYMGRLYIFYAVEDDDPSYDSDYSDYYHDDDYSSWPVLTRARVPRALEVFSEKFTHIARTPKGLWGWGHSFYGQLGFESSFTEFVDPTRLTFPTCPKVAELEASLLAWEKHRMVTDVSMKTFQTFIFTPAGTVMAGHRVNWYAGAVEVENEHHFHPVAVPSGFVPDHIMHEDDTVILTMGDRQIISGSNNYGQLGLGHKNMMEGFEELPFKVDRLLNSEDRSFRVFLSGHQLLFAGEVPRSIAQAGLLPGFGERDLCLTPTPLRFPERVKGFFYDAGHILWVTEGVTHYCDSRADVHPYSIEVTAFDSEYYPLFRDSAGQWFRVAGDSDGAAELVAHKEPTRHESIISVDVDPTPQSSAF